uniref:UDP-glucuronosyltransferase n=1 Tax=Trialeurodes vaporariorum TaxID=88556 RepID=A0A873P555_TRIVP|nr:UDP-gluconosyltransferase [Trialeurodes vaporariorum]
MELIQALKTALLLALMIAASFGNLWGYKILGLFPYNGKSHVIMFKSIMEGLAKRDHDVQVLSHYPLETPLENYTDLSVSGSIPLPNNQKSFELFDYAHLDIFNVRSLISLYHRIEEHEDVMKTEAVQKLMNSTERYDLIITESFVTDMTLGFVNKFKVPFVLLNSCSLPSWTGSLVASPQNPSFIPHFQSRFSPRMTFSERLRNTLGLATRLAAWYWFFVPQNQRIMNRYFGDNSPALLKIAKNVSLVLVNTHYSITGSRPFAPNVLEVGGIHIGPPKTLPRDINDFIESSTHGVIYFCLGSLLRAATLPEEKKEAFLNAFSQLKERVLWKFEDDTIIPPNNVMMRKWMPQRDILAHPKVKLFISHGGLMGTIEAVSEGKPILGMPMTADQGLNIRALESQGMAVFLDYQHIDKKTLMQSMREILKPKYKDRAEEASKIFHDRSMSPMDTAIYWIEYVIRNKGAGHLRSAAVDLPFYQYLLLDVVIFIILCLSVMMYLVYYVLQCTISKRTESKNATKKQN